MALEKFKSNLVATDLHRQIEVLWEKEQDRIRKELLDNFSSFLRSEGFTITTSSNKVTAQYQSAIIYLEVGAGHKGIFPTQTIYYPATIKYNKWSSTVQVSITPNITNQPITEPANAEGIGGYTKYTSDPVAFKKYIDNFQPSKYELLADMENDRSQVGFFGKVFATTQSHKTDKKTFENMKDLVEAILNDEFSFKGIW